MDTFDKAYESIAKGRPVPPQKELSVLVQASMTVIGKPAKQLAEEVDVTVEYIQWVVYGTYIPDRDMLYKLCNAVNLSLDLVMKITVVREHLGSDTVN